MKLNKQQFSKFKKLEALGDKRDKQQEQAYQKLLALKDAKNGESGSDRKKPIAKPGNDFAWFNKYPELMRDAANFLSNWIPGTTLDDYSGVGVTGVVGAGMIDVYGADTSSTDPLNMAARDIFLKMFRKYRGVSAYQAADVGMILVAGVEVIKTVAYLERVYGIINRYLKNNWNMPYSELEAIHVSAAAANYIRDHLSDFRYDLNILILKAQRICIPKDMTILSDKISLYGCEYCDYKDSDRAQLLLFYPTYFGVFNETSLTTGSSVKFTKPLVDAAGVGQNALINYSGVGNMFPVLEQQVDALVSSDSVQKIFGDFMAWFGEENMITMSPLPEDYIVLPVYSESILHKFHNCETVSHPFIGSPVFAYPISCHPAAASASDKSNLDSQYWIHQYDNIIYTAVSWVWAGSRPTTSDYYTFNGVNFAGNASMNGFEMPHHFIDSIHSEFSPEIICEGVLFKKPIDYSIHSVGANQRYFYRSVYAPLEVVDTVETVTRLTNGNTSRLSFYTTYDTGSTATAAAVARMSQFDWAPNYYLGITSGNAALDIRVIGGEIDRVRKLPADDIGKVQRAAVMSAFKSDMEPKA